MWHELKTCVAILVHFLCMVISNDERHSLMGPFLSLKNDTNFIYLKLEGRMSLLPKVHFRPLEVFIMFSAAPLADILVFSTFQMAYSSQGFPVPQPASRVAFLFPPCLGLHSVMTTLPYIGLYCRHWRCMWYERESTDSGSWAGGLRLLDCVAQMKYLPCKYQSLFDLNEDYSLFDRVAMRIKKEMPCLGTLNYTWYQ